MGPKVWEYNEYFESRKEDPEVKVLSIASEDQSLVPIILDEKVASFIKILMTIAEANATQKMRVSGYEVVKEGDKVAIFVEILPSFVLGHSCYKDLNEEEINAIRSHSYH